MKHLKGARLAAGLVIDEMASIAGVTKKTYIQWEAGRTSPTVESLIKFSDRLRVSIDYLCTGKEVDCMCLFLPQLESISIEEAKEICEIYDLLAWKDKNDLAGKLDNLRLVSWAIRREKDNAARNENTIQEVNGGTAKNNIK